jgi:sugar lactone lactonase YvrE
MAIDRRGFLWVAHWGGDGVYVWNPASGELMDKIDVPVPLVASCAFGGDRMNQLYITTARSGLSNEEKDRFPLSGSLFITELNDSMYGDC